MIVRPLADGSICLIKQTDHAELSGQFAAHWGNSTFAAPIHRESSIRAATFHDHGWLRYETSPHYDADSRSTPSFYQTKSDANHYAAYGWAIDWLTEIDPYAGVLISRHRTGLYRNRYGAVQTPLSNSRRRDDPLLDDFVAHYEAKQEVALADRPRSQFNVDYQLLQFWDLFSLALCLREPRPETFSFVPVDYSCDGSTGVTINLTPLATGHIQLDPYPFDRKDLVLGYVYRRLVPDDFADAKSFRRAYFGATPQVMSFTFD